MISLGKKERSPLKIAEIQKENNALQLSKGVQIGKECEVYLIFLLLNSCKVKKLKILKEVEQILFLMKISSEKYLQ